MDTLLTVGAVAAGALYLFTRKKPDATTETLPEVDAPPGTEQATGPTGPVQPVDASRYGIIAVSHDGTRIIIDLASESAYQLPANGAIPGASTGEVQTSLDRMAAELGVTELRELIRRTGIAVSGADPTAPAFDAATAVAAAADPMIAEARAIGERLDKELEQRARTTNAQHKQTFNGLRDQLRKLWVMEFTPAILRQDLAGAQAKLNLLRTLDENVNNIFAMFDTQATRVARMRMMKIHAITNYAAPIGPIGQRQAPLQLQAVRDAVQTIREHASKAKWPWTSSYDDARTDRLIEATLRPNPQMAYTVVVRGGQKIANATAAISAAVGWEAKIVMYLDADPSKLPRRLALASWYAAKLFQLRDYVVTGTT